MLRDMKRSSGFTLIELLVTITIMVILMTLAVANVRSTQVRARDHDRKSDAESIARHLDMLYTKPYSFESIDAGGSWSMVTLENVYPSAYQLSTNESRDVIFKDLPPDILIDPSKDSASESIFIAINNSTTAVSPTPSDSTPYVYQPLDYDGSLCIWEYEGCRGFNLYYRIESTPGTWGMVKSKYR